MSRTKSVTHVLTTPRKEMGNPPLTARFVPARSKKSLRPEKVQSFRESIANS